MIRSPGILVRLLGVVMIGWPLVACAPIGLGPAPPIPTVAAIGQRTVAARWTGLPPGEMWPSLPPVPPGTLPAVTHGPVVGGVSDSTAVVFLRSSSETEARILYSTDPSFNKDLHLSAPVQTTIEGDFTARVALQDLQPSTTYFYKVLLDSQAQELSLEHRFSTAPPPEAVVDFNFAVFSDLADSSTYDAPAYKSAAAEDPAFVLQTGDFDHRNPGDPSWPSITVNNWRRMHQDVLQDGLSGQDFARFITPRFPLYHMWDDHDYGRNNADRNSWWKGLATQAFLEYFPLPPLPNPQGGIWYSFRYAQAEFFMLDLRSQRDPERDPQIPEPSMLNGGHIANDQMTWLKDSLARSTARWKFIISTSVWNPNSKQSDSWHGHKQEQDELVEYIRQRGITGVIVISGDLHSAGGIDDGTNSYFPELSVPTTNISYTSDCTGGFCGLWSEGILTTSDPSGYAMVRVLHDELGGDDSVILETKGEDGSPRLKYTVTLPPRDNTP
jgi:alkaline phosphatase D